VHLERLVDEKVRELELERAKVIHAGKLAALGELATGVAHELNQPLTAMQFEANYLRRVTELIRGRDDWRSTVDLDELAQVGDNLSGDIARCRRIIDHLRTFGRVSDGPSIAVDLNTPLEKAFVLTEQRLRQRGISVVRSQSPDLPPILADPHRLEQVFLNLISNAEYAVKEMRRRIRAGEVEREDYRPQLTVSTGMENGRVAATVRDNGCGIPAEDQDQIFEPFFTTKPLGQGTGLGLSISHSIVSDFGGEIAFQSAEDEGTTFMLRFPPANGT
jgi:histidine kinase